MFTQIWTGSTHLWKTPHDDGSRPERTRSIERLSAQLQRDWQGAAGDQRVVYLRSDLRAFPGPIGMVFEALAQTQGERGLVSHAGWRYVQPEQLSGLISDADVSRIQSQSQAIRDELQLGTDLPRSGSARALEPRPRTATTAHPSRVHSDFDGAQSARVTASLASGADLALVMKALNVDHHLPIMGLREIGIWEQKGALVIGSNGSYFPGKTYTAEEFAQKFGAAGVVLLERTLAAANDAAPVLRQIADTLAQYKPLLATLKQPLLSTSAVIDGNTAFGESGLHRDQLSLSHAPWGSGPLTRADADAVLAALTSTLATTQQRLSEIAPELAAAQAALQSHADLLPILDATQKISRVGHVALADGTYIRRSDDKVESSFRLHPESRSTDELRADLTAFTDNLKSAADAFRADHPESFVSSGDAARVASAIARRIAELPGAADYFAAYGPLVVKDPLSNEEVFVQPDTLSEAAQALGKNALALIEPALQRALELHARATNTGALTNPIAWNESTAWAAFGSLRTTMQGFGSQRELASACLQRIYDKSHIFGTLEQQTAVRGEFTLPGESGTFRDAHLGMSNGELELWFTSADGQGRHARRLTLDAMAAIIEANPPALGRALHEVNARFTKLRDETVAKVMSGFAGAR